METTETTFQLPPFPAFPCISRYVPIGSVQEAIERVSRSIKSNDGISLVMGPPGTGKSLISRILVEQFRETHEVVVLGDATITDQAAFHRHLLHHLGEDLESIVDGDLHLALIDSVCADDAAVGGLLIIIDEAQSLSADVLEAIRMVTNIMQDGKPRVSAVLCGGVKLDETLTAPSLEPFTQRVSTRCYLHPLNAQETRQYISESIRGCEADPAETISDEAMGTIHHACCGVPRLINQLMTEAIDCAADVDQDHICEKTVDRAWAQLQQLPSPMIEEPAITHNASTVEFGALSDEEPGSDLDHLPASQEPLDDDGQQLECTADDSADALAQTPSLHANAASVQWSDEAEQEDCSTDAPSSFQDIPFQDIPESTPLPSELFGDFEVEEPLAIGDGARPADVTDPYASKGIESMVHSEIVSLSELAAEARFGCGEAEVQESTVTSQPSEPAIWIDEPEDIVVADGVGEDLLAHETCELDVFEDDIILSQGTGGDDTDMLVIEDEVDVVPEPRVARVDREETLTVDFRSMLAKMRQGS